VINIYNYYM